MAFLLLLNENRRALRRERVFRDRINPLDKYNDVDMYRKYRFTRLGVIHIIDLIAASLEHPTKRNHALPGYLQVMVGLRFYATGTLKDVVGELHGVSKATASRTVRRVTEQLCRRKQQFIRFPVTEEEVLKKQREFFAISGFPEVVGCVDGTHIGLHGCNYGENEHVYVNRKSKKSINVQLVCDANYKITNVVARWPGSTHDSRILQASLLGQQFENGQLRGILLGDSGYPLRKWLMTPILRPTTEVERQYNR